MIMLLEQEAIHGKSDDRPDRGQASAALLLLLSATAGSTDAIGFLGLNLFTAHITGNIVVLTSHLVASGRAGMAHLIAVPVFMAVLALSRLLGLALERRGSEAARALLVLQFAFLLGFLLIGLALGHSSGIDSPWAVVAGMCGVAAMAVQNGLVQASMPGMPSTAVLTTNVTRFTVTAVESIAGAPAKRGAAREKAAATFLPILGFIVGCAAGGLLEWHLGLSALALPVLLSLAAIPVAVRRSG
jgi:uncharacterized membrane protein YoaK (UPF0700 family)